MWRLSALGVFSIYLTLSSAFYLPGAAPHNYVEGEQVSVFVNALTPMLAKGDNAKLKSLINYDYYNPLFRFCLPEGGPKKQPESLGSILFGDRIFNSPYDIKMLQDNNTCRTLCSVPEIGPEEAIFINERIRGNYALNWLVDGLPASEMKIDARTQKIFFEMGFNLGNNEETQGNLPALNNHYDIELRYHRPTPETYRIVGVIVWPSSIGEDQDTTATCSDTNVKPLVLDEDGGQDIRYTYRVIWHESDTPWATRWDNYLHIFDPRIHWFSFINSLMVDILLCVLVSMILMRSVRRDISRYNSVDVDGLQDDWGWKLIHGDVFRTPGYPSALSVVVGNGAQLFAMLSVTLVFALLGFLSPSNRGALATMMIVCWSLFGCIGGYFSTRVYMSLGGRKIKKNAVITGTLLPVFVFTIVFLLNLFLIVAGSSGAVPFGTLLAIVALWFGISAPLSAIGAYVGTNHGAIRNRVRTNQIPRQIPPGPKYLRPWTVTLLGGILPFSMAYIELHVVLTSLFASRAYYAFGFLALTAGAVMLTAATVSILFTYFQLCSEEYRWQWRAVVTGGGSAIYVVVYGLYYLAFHLSLDSLTSSVLYLGYLGLLALFSFLITGTVGFLASYWTVQRLYSAIRID